MAGFEPRPLGRTGKLVGPLGLAASYGVGEKGVELAFERGVRYFYWGSLRKTSYGKGLKNVLAKDRAGTTLVIQTYTRIGMLMGVSLRRALRWLGTDHCDVLLLGWWNGMPPARIMDAARRLKDSGAVKHLAVSTHERPKVPEFSGIFDIVHVRYNAAHRGAEKEIFPHIPEARDSRAGIVAFTATRWGKLLKPQRGLDGKTPTAADCYRFCLTDPHVDVVIAGARNDQDVIDACDGMAKGPLSPDELGWMRRVGDVVHG
jgi:aryl-alcohol dehydrogenase-like predicted oxidoreductase